MAAETIFLLTLIFALLAGNGMLFFFTPKRQRTSIAINPLAEMRLSQAMQYTAKPLEPQAAGSENSIEKQKTGLLNRQIAALAQKVFELEKVHSNTQVDIKCLTEMVEELEDINKAAKNGKGVKPKTIEKKEPQITDEQMRKIIFNSR